MNKIVDGLIPLCKPKGVHSTKLVSLVKKYFPKNKIGHLGTLDPAASGVLPILIGRANRLQDILHDLPKTYLFEVSLGFATDSLDLDGQIIAQAICPQDAKEKIVRVLPNFIGEVTYELPIYSAVKHRGRPLHEYARQGKLKDIAGVDLQRTIHIYALHFLSFDALNKTAVFHMTCGKGTYVRAIARDLAKAIGTLGTVSRLVRTEASGIKITQTYCPDCLVYYQHEPDELVIPMYEIISDEQKLTVTNEKSIAKLLNGQGVFTSLDDMASVLNNETSLRFKGRSQPLAFCRNNRLVFGLGYAVTVGDSVKLTMKRTLV